MGFISEMSKYEAIAVLLSLVAIAVSVLLPIITYFVFPLFRRLRAGVEVGSIRISGEGKKRKLVLSIWYINRNPDPYHILSFEVSCGREKSRALEYKTVSPNGSIFIVGEYNHIPIGSRESCQLDLIFNVPDSFLGERVKLRIRTTFKRMSFRKRLRLPK